MLGNESYGDEYFDMRTLMHANLSRFAAYKAYHATQELKDISPKDIDKRGRLVLNKYNRWQATEYNTAVARARTAKQYHDFTSDPVSNELYPNIKWLPSRSATPREAHRVFWNSNTPGSLWNCKCDWEETDEPVTNGNPTGNMSAKGLEGNPAKDGVVFTDECPYVKKGGKAVKDFWEPIEQHHNEYLKYLKDADYHDVDFNWNGGMKATHNGHNWKHDENDKKRFFGNMTREDIEAEIQNEIFRMGGSCILRDESKLIAGYTATALDAYINGTLTDISTITVQKESYVSNLNNKNKQIGRWNHQNPDEKADVITLYFHEPNWFSMDKLEESVEQLKKYRIKDKETGKLTDKYIPIRFNKIFVVVKGSDKIIEYNVSTKR